ncbi:MAG: hypothetical protein QS748_12625 [Candidatus Endonucleobacter bathymodioli]|uniref:Ankyrin repeats (3 copies) n=1 Tax=Candidatus Endonucleibacter bathymodioli TaxID=539814 RepID=A0AA90P0S9_9GAMM|nr:hypothetical protein [Candidatus Endonucleobacter bathymodioli]
MKYIFLLMILSMTSNFTLAVKYDSGDTIIIETSASMVETSEDDPSAENALEVSVEMGAQISDDGDSTVKIWDLQPVYNRIKNPNKGINMQDEKGDTPLHFLMKISHESPSSLKRLLWMIASGLKMKVNIKNYFGNTPLHIVLQNIISSDTVLQNTIELYSCQKATQLSNIILAAVEAKYSLYLSKSDDRYATNRESMKIDLCFEVLGDVVAAGPNKYDKSTIDLALGIAMDTIAQHAESEAVEATERVNRIKKTTSRDILLVLMSIESDIEIKNLNGKSPLDLAILYGNKEIIDILKGNIYILKENIYILKENIYDFKENCIDVLEGNIEIRYKDVDIFNKDSEILNEDIEVIYQR